MSNIIGSGTSCSGFEIGVISTSTVEHCFSLGMNKLRKGQIVSFDDDGNNIQSLGVRPNRYNPYCASTITIIKPIRTKTNIYAIDSSSVWLGQTDNGGIYAVKCGIAVASNYNRLHHYKVGPIIFYIND